MARSITRSGPSSDALSEEQWQDLMRSLIEDSDAPTDEASENSLLQDVAGLDHAGEGSSHSRRSHARR